MKQSLQLYRNPSGASTIDAASIKDSMMRVRLYAQYKKKVILVAVYFILIGQLIVILFMYYKRAFMLAFLITLFPLVAMTYVLDKMGDKKAQSFEIWFKEFIVNVIVQLFHAVVYAVIISLGVEKYMTDDGQWLFMIISILFLFEGEKILRGIFNVKSSANTMADLAVTGAAVYGVAKSAKGLMKGGGDSVGSAQDKKDAKGIAQRQSQRAQMQQGGGANAAKTAPASSDSEAGGASGAGGYTGADGSFTGAPDPEGVGGPAGSDTSAARDEILRTAMQRRTSRGLASKGIKAAGKIAGGTVAATYGMSKGDQGKTNVLTNALTSAAAGGMIGGTLTAPVAAVANKIEQKAQGNKTAKAIEAGQMDSVIAQSIPADVNPEEVIGKHGEKVSEIYKQALAEMARVSATKGKAKGEQAYWNYIDENTKSKS